MTTFALSRARLLCAALAGARRPTGRRRGERSLRRERMAGLLAAVLLLGALATGANGQRPATYSNPVVPFDYPDPTVVRVGTEFWAAATGGVWAPIFPIARSRDLVNWTIEGAVFDRPPDWAARDFWAPELVRHRDRYLVYYTARKRGGPLCVAVASAGAPAGPYTDHGPLVCQEVGSIDASVAEDEHGDLYLLWKEDGNSRGLPTPIWAQRLERDGITLAGKPVELLRNDEPWEGHVVEGQYVMRRGGWFYMFYSGNACCGRDCDYALGVARASSLLGPWEKNPANPILRPNAAWRCPGHGTLVDDGAGRDYLLYHAYRNAPDAPYVGRVALLDRVEWLPNGWPAINAGLGPSLRRPAPLAGGNARASAFVDEFEGGSLDPHWRWPVDLEPGVRLEGGRLHLEVTSEAARRQFGAVLARPHAAGSYAAVARVAAPGAARGTITGLAAFSSHENALGIGVGDGRVVAWRRQAGRHVVLASGAMPRGARSVYVRIVAEGGSLYRFAYSRDGRRWAPLGRATSGAYMELVQLALTVAGPKGATGAFDSVRVDYSSRAHEAPGARRS